jgi:hypothetical protein
VFALGILTAGIAEADDKFQNKLLPS